MAIAGEVVVDVARLGPTERFPPAIAPRPQAAWFWSCTAGAAYEPLVVRQAFRDWITSSADGGVYEEMTVLGLLLD